MGLIFAFFHDHTCAASGGFAVLMQTQQSGALFDAEPDGMRLHMAEMARAFELQFKTGKGMTGELKIKRFGVVIIDLPVIGRGDVELFRR